MPSSRIHLPDEDAFVGTELTILPKAKSRARKRVVKSHRKRPISAPTTGLVLRSGYLPVPQFEAPLLSVPEMTHQRRVLRAAAPNQLLKSVQEQTSLPTHPRMSHEQEFMSQLHASLQAHSLTSQGEQATLRSRASAHTRSRMSDEEIIADQLSRVMAPARTHTDSSTDYSSDHGEMNTTTENIYSNVSDDQKTVLDDGLYPNFKQQTTPNLEHENEKSHASYHREISSLRGVSDDNLRDADMHPKSQQQTTPNIEHENEKSYIADRREFSRTGDVGEDNFWDADMHREFFGSDPLFWSMMCG